MPDYKVIPLVGVGPVRLGMTREQVRRAMPGPCEPFRKGRDDEHETDAFHDSSFQVFYGGEGPTVEFIELSSDPGVRALYGGLSVFETPADEVVARIGRDTAFDPSDPELGYSYTFPALELSLWRPVLPVEGNDEGREFSTIGIGVRGYYSHRG
jgi:hypothetical protein